MRSNSAEETSAMSAEETSAVPAEEFDSDVPRIKDEKVVSCEPSVPGSSLVSTTTVNSGLSSVCPVLWTTTRLPALSSVWPVLVVVVVVLVRLLSGAGSMLQLCPRSVSGALFRYASWVPLCWAPPCQGAAACKCGLKVWSWTCRCSGYAWRRTEVRTAEICFKFMLLNRVPVCRKM